MNLRGLKRVGVMLNKITGLCLVLAMIMGLSTSAFATDNPDHSGVNSVIKTSDNVTIEKFNGTILYTYKSKDLVFCSQLEENGMILFSYILPDSNVIYESKPFAVSDFITLSSVEDEDSITLLNSKLIENIDMFEAYAVLECKKTADSTVRSANIDSIVTAALGPSYQNKFFASRTMTYDRSYQLYCYGIQTNRCMVGDSFYFLAGTAISTIYSWIKDNTFEIDLNAFLALVDGATSIIDGVTRLVDEISGNAYTYECTRIKYVTVPSYTSDIVYSTSSISRHFFVYSDSTGTWEVDEVYSYVQPAYNDNDLLFNTAFTRFIYNYVEV